jgi:hypothetical protein
MPDFETFTRKNAKAVRDPALTVTVRGTINLNGAAYGLLGEPEAVTLLYDKAQRTVGLRPAGRDDQNAYVVRPLGKNGTSWTVAAHSFCAWIQADLTAARRYPLALEAGVGCADLRQPGQVVTGNRARRTPR